MPERSPESPRELRVEGRGLHGGEHGAVVVRPVAPGTGWLVGRAGELTRPDPFLAAPEAERCTALRLPGGEVRTVEHLFAALAGLGIRDVAIELEGPEVPILDGSALPWVRALRAHGFPGDGPPAAAGSGPRVAAPLPSFRLRHGGAVYRVEPAERFSATVELAGPSPRLGVQRAAWDGGEESFVRDVAPARTWALLEEVEALRAAGLAKGGSLECAVVLGPEGSVGGPLRFPDEPVRHKLLDLVGDLALLGALPAARVAASSPFHGGNRALARELARWNATSR